MTSISYLETRNLCDIYILFRDKKPMDLGRAIGRLDSEDWAIKQIEVYLQSDRLRTSRPQYIEVCFQSDRLWTSRLQYIEVYLQSDRLWTSRP